MKERVWINFKELRTRLKFDDVLRHYKVEVKSKGEQHHGPCPLPGHSGSKSAPSFSANLKRGIFHCFSCGAKGNLLEFAALMSGVDPKDGTALRKVAVELQTQFCPEGASTRTKPSSPANQPVPMKTSAPTVLVNPPLDFALKDLDVKHPYLLGRGFKPETIEYFGLGFCFRGLLKGKVAVPLHDQQGRLVGYAGCDVNDSTMNDDERFCFPTSRERNGTAHEFNKSLLLYNRHRIKAPCDDLIVVQGFHSAWWLHQCGFADVVALMGAECPENQAEQIASLVRESGRVWLMPDGNQNRERLAQSLLVQVSPRRFARWLKLESQRPADLSPEELKFCFMK